MSNYGKRMLTSEVLNVHKSAQIAQCWHRVLWNTRGIDCIAYRRTPPARNLQYAQNANNGKAMSHIHRNLCANNGIHLQTHRIEHQENSESSA